MGAPKRIDWDKQPLGEVLDSELADSLCVTTSAVCLQRCNRGISRYKKRIIDYDAQPLGVLSDNEIARRLGVANGTVSRARVVRNIHPSTKCLRKGINWDEQPLGEMLDSELSRQLGVLKATVSRARFRRNIPAYREPCSICGTPITPRSSVKTQFNRCSLCHRYTDHGTTLSDMDNLSISEKKAKLLANITPEKLEKYRAKRRKNNE